MIKEVYQITVSVDKATRKYVERKSAEMGLSMAGFVKRCINAYKHTKKGVEDDR